jgi:hypothetical protein
VSDLNNTAVDTKADSNLSFAPENFADDLAKLAAASGMTLETPQADIPLTPPNEPEQPKAQEMTPEPEAPVTKTDEATQKVEVPEKFKAPDGSVDTAKLEKSMVNVEQALAQYLEKEKELKRKMNEVKKQENAYITPPQTPAPTPVIPINTEFAKQLEADIQKEGAGVVLAKLFTAAQESVEERVKSEIESLKSVNAANATKAQIEAIGKNDPWVYTPEGMATLTQMLEEQPYLWNAPDPYKAAYLIYSGQKSVVSKSVPQVLTPTPTARPTAPVPSGQAAAPANTTPSLRLETKEDIENHLKKLTPAQQSAFFQKMGFPGF